MNLTERIPVTTVTEARKARVELRERIAAALGRTRSGVRIPEDATPMYDAAENVLSAYAADQDFRIRRVPRTYYIGISPSILRGIEAMREAR